MGVAGSELTNDGGAQGNRQGPKQVSVEVLHLVKNDYQRPPAEMAQGVDYVPFRLAQKLAAQRATCS